MKLISRRMCLSRMTAVGLGASSAPRLFAAESAEKPLPAMELTCVERAVVRSATFQSHNQKVVRNRRGIFLTYLKDRNADYTLQTWRVAHSTDNGATFSTLFEARHATNPPVLETDSADNLYLVRPDFTDGHAYLYRFLAEEDFREPHVSQIPNGAAGKFALAFDDRRNRLTYFAHNNTFHLVEVDGAVEASVKLLRAGKNAVLQYPSLGFTPDGALYAAWTTVAHGQYLYWDIHAIRSPDGGHSWQKLDGAPLAPPLIADDQGPTDRITRDQEFEVQSWLSNMLPHGGKLHFFYRIGGDPQTMRYARYDLHTGRVDAEHTPELRGETLSLCGLDGFFAARTDTPDSPLYCVMKSATANRLACLRSDDQGRTWVDHALSPPVQNPYAVGGCRTVTPDGWIIGSFTEAIEPNTGPIFKSNVQFFRIRA